MSQIYQDDYETLEDLLAFAGSSDGATLLIPDLQRPYVWSPIQVINLVDSLVRGWPFGSLLLWSVSEGDVAKMPSRQFAMQIDRFEEKDAKVLPKHAPATYRMVLDGQQRVQSLLLAFGGDGWGFRMLDRAWHEALNGKRSPGRHKYPHWSSGELCVDLEKLAEEFSRAKSVGAMDFASVLCWAIRDPHLGQSVWHKKQPYDEPLNNALKVKGRYVRLSRLWSAIKVPTSGLAQLKRAATELLTEHQVTPELSASVGDALIEVINALQSVKQTRVTFLEVNRYSNDGMGTSDDYSDAVVSIFTRLNTAGRTLTREEITFAWIKNAWGDPAKTKGKGAGDCFQELRGELETEAQIEVGLDDLVGAVSLLWAVRFNAGKVLVRSDLLKGDKVKPMAAQIAANWELVRETILSVSKTVTGRGLVYGKHYQSLNSLALLWAWKFIGGAWGRQHATGTMNADAWEKSQASVLAEFADRWLIASQWAGSWGEAASNNLISFCGTLSKASAEIDTTTLPEDAIAKLRESLAALVNPLSDDAGKYIETLEVEVRERVRAYFLPLWVWHRLDISRWEASRIPLRRDREQVSLDVDHIVSVGLCSDYGFPTANPTINEEEDELSPAGEKPLTFVKVNALGNCWLLETKFNLFKHKKPASQFLDEVAEFKGHPEKLAVWLERIRLPEVLIRPSKDAMPTVAQAIEERTRGIRADLKAFAAGTLSRVDINREGSI